MATINPDRLLTDLRTLRSIGAKGPGVVRPAFSATDMEARRWLKGRYEEAAALYSQTIDLRSLRDLRGLTCPANPAGKILDELSFVRYLCDE